MSATRATQAFRNAVAEIFISKTALHRRWIPSGDAQSMTAGEWRAYCAAFDSKPMRFVVHLYWLAYRFERWRGAIPQIVQEGPEPDPEAAWEPMEETSIGA